MKNICIFMFLILIHVIKLHSASFTDINVTLGNDYSVKFFIDYGNSLIDDISNEALYISNGEISIKASYIRNSPKGINIKFNLNSSNYEFFHNLINNTSDYYFDNDFKGKFNDGTDFNSHDLIAATKGKIKLISNSSWGSTVLNDYSMNYFFPEKFDIGPSITTSDSSKTSFYFEISKVFSWSERIHSSVQGRWSNDENDKLNYLKVYPLIYEGRVSNSISLAGMIGLEKGMFSGEDIGRGLIKGELKPDSV